MTDFKASHQANTTSRFRLRAVLIFIAYLSAFTILDASTRSFQVFPGVVAWYPPDGLSFALLLSFGASFSPWLAVASLVSSFFIFKIPLSLFDLLGWAILLSLVYGLAAWFLRRRVRMDTQLHSMRDFFWLIAFAVVVSTVLALVSMSVATANGIIPRNEQYWATVQWWVGEMIGVLVLTPFLLIHVMPHVKRFAEGEAFLKSVRQISLPRLSLSLIAQALSILIAIYLAVGIGWPNDFHPFFLIAIPLVWISIHYGLPGASIGVVLVDFGVTWGIQSHSQFNLQELGQLQLVMLVVTLASLFIGLIASENRRSLRLSGGEIDRRKRSIVYELIIISIAVMSAWVLEYTFDFYEAVTAWEQSSRIKGVDETLAAILVLGLASTIFSYRRWRELQVEIRGREKAQAELQTLFRELEDRVQERTIELSEANKLLQTEIVERARIEATLRDNEDRYRDLVNHSQDLICTHDLTGRLLSVNPHAEHVLGYETGALLNANIRDFLAPETKLRFDAYLSEIKEHGISEGTMLVQTMGGEVLIWKYRNTLRTEGVSEPVVRGMAHDVTEQYQAEQALRESEQRFRHLFTTSPDAILLIDPHDPNVSWPIIDCNEAACRMNGYSREEMIGQSIDLLNFAPGTREERKTYLEEVRREKVIFTEAFHQHKDGHIFPIEVLTSLFTLDGRELILGIDRDITERMLAKESLEQSEKRFRALVENSTDAITLFDSNGVTLYDSPAAPGMLGYGPDELIGESVFGLIHPDDITHVQLLFQNLVKTTDARMDATFRVHHKDGSWLWIEAVVTNMLTEPGVQAIVANYRDITVRKRAEDALNESDKRFRNLFESSPVSIWEEDFSQIKAYLDELKKVVDTDFEVYLNEHPEVVSKCVSLVKIIDVNQASMDLYGVDDKPMLIENLSNVFVPESFDTFRQELLAVWNGEHRLEVDGMAQTLDGLHKDVTIIWAVAAGYEENYSRVLVSLIDITERVRATKEIRSRTDELSTLYDLSRALARANNLEDVLDLVTRRTVKSVQVTFARIALLEENDFVICSAYPIRALDHDLYVGDHTPIAAMPYCRHVLEQDETVILHTTDQKVGADERKALLLDYAQTLCLVPLRVRDFDANSSHTLGLLMLGEARGEQREPFTPEKLRLARSIGDQAAIAIDNTHLFTDLQRSNNDLRLAYDATIAGWSAAMDLRDEETEGHTLRVTQMTLKLAGKMGFSERELVHVKRGALLHDIGKLGVPDRILLKPGKLTDEEWVIMRMHPTFAYEMLKPINYLEPALDIPYCHHEKWDGTGYPRGLKGKNIPLAARIFSVIDVFDALTSDRPYRAAWSREKTLDYIRELSGSHFDPRIVDVFLKTAF